MYFELILEFGTGASFIYLYMDAFFTPFVEEIELSLTCSVGNVVEDYLTV
jgi:hypothetical protein